MAKKNPLKHPMSRLLTPLALALALAACSSTPTEVERVDITQAPTQTVEAYLIKADTHRDASQNDWRLMALKAAIQANDVYQANLLLFKLSKEALNESQTAEWQLARTELLLERNQAENALDLLMFDPSWSLSDSQWARYYQTQEKIFTALARWFDVSVALVEQYAYAPEAQRSAISEQIWQALGHFSAQELEVFAQKNPTQPLLGWLQLARMKPLFASDVFQLQKSIKQWNQNNPTHPAALYPAQSMVEILAMDVPVSQHTALLLPLSGKFESQAGLIRDGFILSMFNDGKRNPNATLEIIDTQAQPLSEIATQLAQSNIDFIVGPLLKENIAQLTTALQSERVIPQLALNIPEKVQSNPTLCYFALSPEQEASQTAKYFFEQGVQFPMIIAPAGNYGQRIIEAFNQTWSQLSEHKVAKTIIESKNKMQLSINQSLGLQESQQNIAQMQAMLDLPLESQPRSRRDIDAIYIIADGADLSLIKPFIDVAINPEAEKPTLYASSRSHTNESRFEDVTDIIFSDIPLNFQPDSELAQQLNGIWPNRNFNNTRLIAMGIDAYQLMRELPTMKQNPEYSIQAQTGKLSLDANCVVERKVNWSDNANQ